MSHAELSASKDVHGKARIRFAQAVMAKPQRTVAQSCRQNQLENVEPASPTTVLADYPQELGAVSVLVFFQGQQFGQNGRIF